MYPAPVSPVPTRQECIRIGQWSRGLGVRNYGLTIARGAAVFPSPELLKIALARLIYSSVPLRPHPCFQSAPALFDFWAHHDWQPGEHWPAGTHQLATRLVTPVPGAADFIAPRRYNPDNAFFIWGMLATWAGDDLGNPAGAWAFFDFNNSFRSNVPDPDTFAAQCALAPADRDTIWNPVFNLRQNPSATGADMGTLGGTMPFVNGPGSNSIIGPNAPHL